jgi:hypothetical protein
MEYGWVVSKIQVEMSYIPCWNYYEVCKESRVDGHSVMNMQLK